MPALHRVQCISCHQSGSTHAAEFNRLVPTSQGYMHRICQENQEVRPRIKKPSLYRVVLLNDDYTPMDFVVEVLEDFFSMNREQATRVMLTVHTEGKAVCGLYPQDIAETKATQVVEYARENQHPLMCQVEKA